MGDVVKLWTVDPEWTGVLRWLKESGLPVTRKNFIDFNWVDRPPSRREMVRRP